MSRNGLPCNSARGCHLLAKAGYCSLSSCSWSVAGVQYRLRTRQFPGISVQVEMAARRFQFFILFGSVLIVFNLERTLRSSVGRMRWQIKFVALGVGGLFALRIYLASQSVLFSNLDTGLGAINSVALIAANLLFAISLARG